MADPQTRRKHDDKLTAVNWAATRRSLRLGL